MLVKLKVVVTRRGYFRNWSLLFMRHEADNREDDETSKHRGRWVDCADYKRVPGEENYTKYCDYRNKL